MYVLPVRVCLCMQCHGHQDNVGKPMRLDFRWLWVAVWVLGVDPGPYEGAVMLLPLAVALAQGKHSWLQVVTSKLALLCPKGSANSHLHFHLILCSSHFFTGFTDHSKCIILSPGAFLFGGLSGYWFIVLFHCDLGRHRKWFHFCLFIDLLCGLVYGLF